MNDVSRKITPDTKTAYTAPKLEKFGRMSVVTQKSGLTPDQNQVTKPAAGTG